MTAPLKAGLVVGAVYGSVTAYIGGYDAVALFMGSRTCRRSYHACLLSHGALAGLKTDLLSTLTVCGTEATGMLLILC